MFILSRQKKGISLVEPDSWFLRNWETDFEKLDNKLMTCLEVFLFLKTCFLTTEEIQTGPGMVETQAPRHFRSKYLIFIRMDTQITKSSYVSSNIQSTFITFSDMSVQMFIQFSLHCNLKAKYKVVNKSYLLI